MMDDVRILKGWTKEEQKELEKVKEIGINDFLHIITGLTSDTRFGLIWEKYDKAEQDEGTSVIRDILDFYTDRAKFAEPKKYYVHLIKGDEYSYLNINPDVGAELDNRLELRGWKTKFTRDEVVAIDPRFVPFMEEVEDDE